MRLLQLLYRQQITGFFLCFSVRVGGVRGRGRLLLYVERLWTKKSFICSALFCYYIKQTDSMLLCICSVIDHRRRQNVLRTSFSEKLGYPFVCHFFVLTTFCSLRKQPSFFAPGLSGVIAWRTSAIHRRKFHTDDENLSRIWSWALIGSISNYAKLSP